MKIHYENNAPFLTISSITRTIEVSHWGNIAVEETIDLRHTGAYLKGPFSRYDYQRQSDSGISSIKSFKVGSANCFLASLCYSMFSERIGFVCPVFSPFMYSVSSACRRSSLLLPKTCTTGTRSGTSPPLTCRSWKTPSRLKSAPVSPYLEGGRRTISSDTICPATSTSTPWVRLSL